LTETEQRISAALNGAVDRINPDLIEKILAAEAVAGNTGSTMPAGVRRLRLRRFSTAIACAVVLIAAVVVTPHLTGLKAGAPETAAASSRVASNGGGASVAAGPSAGSTQPAKGDAMINGVNMSPYYQYNGNYYSLGDAEPDIQNNIEKSLDSDLYQIKGEDTSQSIAIFINSYYRLLTYAFGDTVTWNGKTYLLSPNTTVDGNVDSGTKKLVYKVGRSLGKAGNFDAYEIPGVDTSEEIAVNVGKGGNDYDCIAYQLPASVTLNNKTYWLQPQDQIYDIQSEGNTETYLGMAGSYKAYKFNGYDPSQTIMLHISEAKEMQASAIVPSPADQPLPKSLYGSVFESMYACYALVHWEGHGAYMVNDNYNSDAGQARLSALGGSQLGSLTEDGGYIYPILSMKGTDPSKAVIIKNNQAYVEYDFIYPDTLTFQGGTYAIPSGDNPYENSVRGEKIGTASGFPVYAIKGVDPSKAIMAQMSGSTSNGGMSMTETLIRKNP